MADVLSRINVVNQTFEGKKGKIAKVYYMLKDRKDLEHIMNQIVLQQEQDTKISNIRRRLTESEAIINQFYCVYNLSLIHI